MKDIYKKSNHIQIFNKIMIIRIYGLYFLSFEIQQFADRYCKDSIILIILLIRIGRMIFFPPKLLDYIKNPNSKVQVIHQIALLLYGLRTDEDLANIYKCFSLYNQSKDQHAKTHLRFEIEAIHNSIHKSNIFALLKGIKQKQKRLSQKTQQCSTLQKRLEFQQSLNLFISNLYHQLQKPSGNALICQDNLLQCTLTHLHNESIKYRCLWKVINGFSRKQKRPFLEMLGQDSKHFQSQEIAALQKFSKQILKEGAMSAITSFVKGDKQLNSELKYIQIILDKIQKANDAQTLSPEVKDEMKKINNYYMMRRFINNIKQMKKIQYILCDIKMQIDKESDSIENIISKIKADIVLQNKLKNILQALTKQLFQYRKCQRIFRQFNIQMRVQDIQIFFTYWNDMTKLLKAAMKQLNIQFEDQQKEEFITISNKNIFKLSEYFEKLIFFIKANKIYPTNKNENRMQQIDGEIQIEQFMNDSNDLDLGNKKVNFSNLTDNVKKVIEQKDAVARQLNQELDDRKNYIQMLQKRITQQNKTIQQYKKGSKIQKQKGQDENSEDSYKSLGDQDIQQVQRNQINCKDQAKQNENPQGILQQKQQIEQVQNDPFSQNTQTKVDIKTGQLNEPSHEQQVDAGQPIPDNAPYTHLPSTQLNEWPCKKNSNYNSLYYDSKQYRQYKQYQNYDYNRVSGQSAENAYTLQIKQLLQNEQKLNIKIKQQEEDMFVITQQKESLLNKCNIYEQQLESNKKYLAFLENKVNTLELCNISSNLKPNQTQTKLLHQNGVVQKIDTQCNTQDVEHQLEILQLQKKHSYQNQISAKSQQYVAFLQEKIGKLQVQNNNLSEQIVHLSRKPQRVDQLCNTQVIEGKKVVKQQQEKQISRNNNREQIGVKLQKPKNYHTFCFYGKIFNQFCSQQQQKAKFNFIKNIQILTGKSIKRTIKLYETDRKNKINPHEYIDNNTNWIALFKLRNGYIVGAFSQLQLSMQKNKQQAGHKALLSNLNKQVFYKQLAKKEGSTKIYQYEQYYLVIGNSQIRYNFQSYELQHNFGNSYKYFDTGKDNAQMFYGTKESAMEVQVFQFHHAVME